MDGDKHFADWRRFVLASRADIVHVFWSRKVYRAIVTMFRVNERLSNVGGRQLLGWLQELYSHEAAMLVRRELDKQYGVLNLLQLLHDVEKNFGVLVAHSESAVLPSVDEVKADRERLESEVRPVRAYAERLLAHRTDATGLELSTEDVDLALATVAETMRKYHNYINAADLLSPTPSAAYDWLSPFRIPWLTPEWREPHEDGQIDD